MAKAKESIKNLRYIAESSGYSCWQDYLYDYCLNGHNLRDLCDKMSKYDTLQVIDALVAMELHCVEGGWDINLLQKMYLNAFCSLGDRL
jgi:hypothetical protein